MRNLSVLERVFPLPFDNRSNFDKERERVVIYPKIRDIVMIEGDDNYSKIFFTPSFQQYLKTVNGNHYLRLAKTLKFFELRLEKYGCFFRCNRSAIINLHHVTLLKFRTIYLQALDRAVFLSAESVTPFKGAMDRI